MNSNPSPLLSFVIPFRSKDSTGGEESWRRVSRLLQETVSNLLAQTSSDFSIHIVGDDLPEGGLPEDDKLFFHLREFQHPVSYDVLGQNRDRRMKVVQACMHAGALHPRFIMPVDADDRISVNLVDWLHRQEDSDSWIVDHGYRLDLASRRYILSDNYSSMTSSACILSAELTGIPADLSFGAMETCYWFLGGHDRFKSDMQQRGITVNSIPFPAGCYLTGYGDNLSNVFRRSWVKKLRRWVRFHFFGKPLDQQLLSEFGAFNP